MRTTEEVFDDHLRLRDQGEFETDLQRNYGDDIVMLTCTVVYRGHDGLRECHRELEHYLPRGRYRYVRRLVEGEIAFLVWSGRSAKGEVHYGVDTFLIRDGKIRVQTIHYSVRRDRSGTPSG